MKKILLIILFWQNFYSQVVNIPDVNFRNTLINVNCAYLNNDNSILTDVDQNNDNQIDINEALSVSYLYIYGQNISNLEGLQSFENLIGLDFSYNPIEEVNLFGLHSLYSIKCNNTNLYHINACDTSLYSLVCFNSPNLISINVKNNIITSSYFRLAQNAFIPPPLPNFFVFNCPNLSGICYDEGEYSALEYNFNNDIYNYNLSTTCDCTPQVNLLEDVFVYPNPVENNLYIAYNKSTIPFEINFYNNLGIKCNIELKNFSEFDCSKFSSGNYYIEIKTNKGNIIKKFLKK